MNQLLTALTEKKPVKVFLLNDYYAKFEYDETLKRYQSNFGYASLKFFIEVAKGNLKDYRLEI